MQARYREFQNNIRESLGRSCPCHGLRGRERWGAASCCTCQSTFPPNRREITRRRILKGRFPGPTVNLPMSPQEIVIPYDRDAQISPPQSLTEPWEVVAVHRRPYDYDGTTIGSPDQELLALELEYGAERWLWRLEDPEETERFKRQITNERNT